MQHGGSTRPCALKICTCQVTEAQRPSYYYSNYCNASWQTSQWITIEYPLEFLPCRKKAVTTLFFFLLQPNFQIQNFDTLWRWEAFLFGQPFCIAINPVSRFDGAYIGIFIFLLIAETSLDVPRPPRFSTQIYFPPRQISVSIHLPVQSCLVQKGISLPLVPCSSRSFHAQGYIIAMYQTRSASMQQCQRHMDSPNTDSNG